MKNLREIVPLEEAFDSSYPVKIKHTDHYSDVKMTDGYFNTHGGTSMHVDVMHNPHNKTAHVSFHGYGNDDDDKRDSGYDKTGTEKNHASKVFGTVKKVLQAHLKRHPDVKTINFSCDESHSKLYDKLMNKYIGSNGKRRGIGGGAVDYEFDANKLRESELREAFDSSYPVDIHHNETKFNKTTLGRFKSNGGNHINVTVIHGTSSPNPSAHVIFDNESEFSPTGKEKHSAVKVFGTVKKVIQAHLKKYPEVKQIEFTGDASHEKLYNHMVNPHVNNGSGSKFKSHWNYAHYTIHSKHFQESFDPLELQDK